MRPRKAAVDDNLGAVGRRIQAAGDALDLLVFPETVLSGYFLEGGVVEAAREAGEVARALGVPAPGAPDVVLGFYERWRRRLYNSVAWLTAGEDRWEIVHVHRKIFLPTYGVFDEARFVENGRDLQAFDTRFGRMGMLICEEMWHSLPSTVLALAGAEVVVVVSASPARDFGAGEGRPGNLERWERIVPVQAAEHGVFVLVSQLVGSEGGKVFPGGSLAVGPDGATLARGPLLDEAVTEVTLDRRRIERARAESPLLADLEQMLPHLRSALDRAHEDAVRASVPGSPDGRDDGVVPTGDAAVGPPESVDAGDGRPRSAPDDLTEPDLELDLDLVERTLVHFIRDEVVERRGFEQVVLGVSGGVDSSVSLYLAVRALGPENVYGFRLPYRTSSDESLEHAARVLGESGAHERTIDISEPIDRYVETYEPEIDPTRKGNLMARLRSVILFDQSAKRRALPLGTGNKSERLLGYFTWHADDSPPINPLGDLFKTQVWALARHLGVPGEIVRKPATADLVKGVTDEDEIGIGYHRADPILYWLIRGYGADELIEGGFPADEVQIVRDRLHGTHWKRELPTVAVLSSSAIGEFYLRPVDY